MSLNLEKSLVFTDMILKKKKKDLKNTVMCVTSL